VNTEWNSIVFLEGRIKVVLFTQVDNDCTPLQHGFLLCFHWSPLANHLTQYPMKCKSLLAHHLTHDPVNCHSLTLAFHYHKDQQAILNPCSHHIDSSNAGDCPNRLHANTKHIISTHWKKFYLLSKTLRCMHLYWHWFRTSRSTFWSDVMPITCFVLGRYWQFFNQKQCKLQVCKDKLKKGWTKNWSWSWRNRKKCAKKRCQWASRRELVDKVPRCCASIRACMVAPVSGTTITAVSHYEVDDTGL